jgi:hypothetical protein
MGEAEKEEQGGQGTHTTRIVQEFQAKLTGCRKID